MCKRLISVEITDHKSNYIIPKRKITLMLFFIFLLDQVYSYKTEDLKASEDMAEQRHVIYSTTDFVEVDSPSNRDTRKRVKRLATNCDRPKTICPNISKRNQLLGERFLGLDWNWSNSLSIDTNSPHHNNYYAAPQYIFPQPPVPQYQPSQPRAPCYDECKRSPKQCKKELMREYISCQYSK